MTKEALRIHDDFGEHGHEYTEIEAQYELAVPGALDHFKQSSELMAIEQVYLSQPDEPFSLRLRETLTRDGVSYSATLKDRGRIVSNGLLRLEIETPISAQTYQYYTANTPLPRIRKLRAEPTPGVTVDWNDGTPLPIVEIEDNQNPDAAVFLDTYGPVLIDKTGQPDMSSEALAYAKYPPELRLNTPELPSPEELVRTIHEAQANHTGQLVVAVAGRSGSGKSTLARQLSEHLEASPAFAGSITHLSTDDYHRGKRWLESHYGAPWTNWDAPQVYDTAALALDIQKLSQGKSIEKRAFDFATEEPIVTGQVKPSQLIIIDGIYAASPDLDPACHLLIPVPTPLATSIGRRLHRDITEKRLNVSLGRPEDILRYQLEVAEPTYRAQAQR